ncbi:MAG: Fur family transcriptional regulator [Flavobacteriaceae bacterium]
MGIVRKTKSLELVLNEFQSLTTAISVIDLIKKLNSKLNKTTIYRILEKLEDDGIVHSFLGKNGIKWYAKCRNCSKSNHSDVHPHFECIDCGKIDCLTVEIKIPSIPNREVRSSQILFQGICESCFR